MQNRNAIFSDFGISEKRNLSVDPDRASILTIEGSRLTFDDTIIAENTCHGQTSFLNKLKMHIPFGKKKRCVIIDVFFLEGTNILLRCSEGDLRRGSLLEQRLRDRAGMSIAGILLSNDIWVQRKTTLSEVRGAKRSLKPRI